MKHFLSLSVLLAAISFSNPSLAENLSRADVNEQAIELGNILAVTQPQIQRALLDKGFSFFADGTHVSVRLSSGTIQGEEIPSAHLKTTSYLFQLTNVPGSPTSPIGVVGALTIQQSIDYTRPLRLKVTYRVTVEGK